MPARMKLTLNRHSGEGGADSAHARVHMNRFVCMCVRACAWRTHIHAAGTARSAGKVLMSMVLSIRERARETERVRASERERESMSEVKTVRSAREALMVPMS